MTETNKAVIGVCILIIVFIIATSYAWSAEAPPPQPVDCISTEEIVLKSMAQSGIAPKVALTGPAVEPFKEFVTEAKGSPLSPKAATANHVLIFKNGENALVAWFHDTCM